MKHTIPEVLFVSHDACPSGAQYSLLTLTTWLKEGGLLSPRFIMGGPGALLEEFSRVGPVLTLDGYVPGQSLQGDEGHFVRLLRSFCGSGVSAVYLNSAASGHVANITRHLQVPHLAHVHELQKSIERWVGSDKMNALRQHVDLFIAASNPVADNLHRKHTIPRDQIKVVEEFIKCAAVRETTDAERRKCNPIQIGESNAKMVLGCGTADWRKGPDIFVQVAEQVLLNHRKPVNFVWVGGETASGELERLRDLVAKKRLRKRVHFIGAVVNPFPYMLGADLFLLPSREDPFPLVCLEAADCGIPTVCFADAGGMPDFVGSDCGAVVPFLDVDCMAHSVADFLNNESKRRLCGKRARLKVRREHDVAVKGREIYQLVRGLCRRELPALSATNGS